MKLSDGEKLILHMLCDLFEHQRVESEIDPRFVRDALYAQQLWAIEEEYPGIFDGEATPDAFVSEVVDHLLMWDWLETAWEAFDDETRAALKAEGLVYGEKLHFPGYDGNNEGRHLHVANWQIERMDKFQLFAGRDLNSHHPVIGGYRGMFAVFDGMWRGRDGLKKLSADEVRKILRARYPDRKAG